MFTNEIVVEHPDIQPGSDRSFGLIVGGILAAIGVYQFYAGIFLAPWFFGLGAVLLIAGAIIPRILHPLNVLWTKLGLLLGRIVTPVVMFLVYVVSVVPIGLLLRLFRKDILGLKPKSGDSSYWIHRDPPGPTPESLKDQF